jgi:signal transduction histidine kinase
VKSLSLKVTIWTVAALVISLAMLNFIGRSVMGRAAAENYAQINQVLFDQAIIAYESSGSAGLARYMHGLGRIEQTRYSISDASGHDLETGEDHSRLVGMTIAIGKSYYSEHGRITIGKQSRDGRYIWLATFTGPSRLLFAPFYILLLATVVALYWLVTVYITLPVRRLAEVVVRFGSGNLAARAKPQSKDEIGNLGRSFNAMAERIQILLTSERQLLQDVSHELRSPLARLTFEAEMVRKSADRNAAATRLRQEIDRLSELVGSLIDMARAEGEPGAVEMEEICLNELLQSTAQSCEVEAQAASCHIHLDTGEETFLRGNAELLRRAIENVLRNAIRFSPAGVAVEIALKRQTGSAQIMVRDFGPGIPDAMKNRVFDPFFRVDASRDARTGGLGLGLAIARRAVRVHHGDIAVSDAFPGALLTITLPLESAIH